MAEKAKKKVVRVEHTAAAAKEDASFTPSVEAKSKATKFRIFAWVLWLLAIGGEAFAYFWIMQQDPINMFFLIAAIVLIGVFAIFGSILWKRANQADPAKRSEPTRFFIQNQLGAIVTAIAFLPLIILILLNKDMDGKQKGIAGGIAVVVMLIAGYVGTTQDSPSVEKYDAESIVVMDLTGGDQVFWTKSGEVYHLCEAVSAVNQDSADNQIYQGTVGDAHAAGKKRLTLQVDQELAQCGFDAVAPDATTDEAPAESMEATPAS